MSFTLYYPQKIKGYCLRAYSQFKKLPVPLIAGLCLGSLTHIAKADLKQTLDWVPLSQLTEEQRQQLPIGSCGAYISPIVSTDSSLDVDAPIETSSNQSKIIETNGLQEISLIGDVLVNKGYRSLSADEARYSEATGSIVIDGKLTIREPDLLLLANKGVINQTQDTLVIEDATYVIHSSKIRGTGTSLSKNQQVIKLEGGEYTQCAPGNNDWTLRGSKIEINTEKSQGVATNVRLVVKGIPVFYWPYLRFPVGDERLSGFLFPSLELKDSSLNVSVPYYFNLAPNYDLILTPHLLQNHGTLLEANARHLSRHFETDLNITHLSNDKGKLSDSEQSLVSNGTRTLDEVTPFAGEDRWSVNINQIGGESQRWFSGIDYSEVSDIDYLEDFDGSTLNNNSEVSLKQQIKAGYQFTNWRLEVNNQQFQILRNNIRAPFKQLPQVSFDGNYSFDDIQVNLENEWIKFDHSDADDNNNPILVGDRTRLKYSVGLDKENDSGFFRPRVQARYLGYNLDDRALNAGANEAPSIVVPQAVVDSGLFFDREGSGYLQTFEPRLFFFHSPFKDQNNLTNDNSNLNFDTANTTFSYNRLFTDTRFSGGDRIDDADQISLGLTTRFIGAETGLELLRVSVGKAFYNKERRVTLNGITDTSNNSPIAAQITSSFNEFWQLDNNIIYNDDQKRAEDVTSTLRYRGDDGRLFNIGYRFLRDRSEQAEISIIEPLASNRWHLIGHINYDYNNNRELERLLGFEYNSCCYRARFLYQRTIDDDQIGASSGAIEYDEGIALEFQFLGLGSTGKQFDNLLDDTIDGYEQWQATHAAIK